MKRIIAGLAATLFASALQAQSPAASAIAKGDSVIVFIHAPPQPYYGFVIHGLRQDTVRPETDAQVFAIRLGTAMQNVMRATAADNAVAVLRRLQNDDFAASLLSVLYPEVGAATARSWREGGRPAGSVASYRIEFLDAHGAVTQSITAQTTVTDVLPLAPAALRARSGNNRITLEWKYGERNDNTLAFNIYRKVAGESAEKINEAPVLRETSKAPSFVDFNVMPGGTYDYTVRALDVVGREGPPAGVTITLRDSTPPAPAASLVARVDKERVMLVWPMAPEPDAKGYFVERSTGNDKPFTRITAKRIAVDQPTFTDTTSLGDIQYFYRVITVDSAGNESVASNPATAFPVDRTPPQPPAALHATVLPGHRISLAWSASASKDVTGYYVYRQDKMGGTPTRVTGTPILPPFLDAGPDSVGLPAGRTFVLSVSAVDAAFNESPQVSIDAAIPDDQPPAPATGFNIENVQGRYANIRWSISPSLDVKAYELQRSGRSTPWLVKSSAERLVRDTTIEAGQVYVYTLTAIDTANNRSAAIVDTLRFRDLTPPSAPRNAVARRMADGVHVGWERVADRDLAGYLVFRSGLPTGVYTQLTPAPLTTLTFVDATAPADAFYVVRAVDRSQNQSAASPVVKAIAR